MADTSDISLSLTTTSSGTPQPAAVGAGGSSGDGMGGYPNGGSDTAVMADTVMSAEEFSDMEVGVNAHLAPSNLNRLRRTSSRSTSRTRRTIFKDKTESSPGGKSPGNRVQTRIDILEFELDDARRQQRTNQDQVAHAKRMKMLRRCTRKRNTTPRKR